MIYVTAKSETHESNETLKADSFEMVVKVPAKFGNSSHVILPVSSIGKKVVVVIVD